MKSVIWRYRKPSPKWWRDTIEFRANRQRDKANATEIYADSLMKIHCRYDYRFQYGIPPKYILDFYIPQLKLAIEIDGDSHNGREPYDFQRDTYLRQIGIETKRFTANSIWDEPHIFIDFINHL